MWSAPVLVLYALRRRPQYLPAKLDVCVFCRLTPEQIDTYTRVVNAAMSKYNAAASATAASASTFQAVTQLKQIVNNPVAAMRALAQGQLGASGAQPAASAPPHAQAAPLDGQTPCTPTRPVAFTGDDATPRTVPVASAPSAPPSMSNPFQAGAPKAA